MKYLTVEWALSEDSDSESEVLHKYMVELESINWQVRGRARKFIDQIDLRGAQLSVKCGEENTNITAIFKVLQAGNLFSIIQCVYTNAAIKTKLSWPINKCVIWYDEMYLRDDRLVHAFLMADKRELEIHFDRVNFA